MEFRKDHPRTGSEVKHSTNRRPEKAYYACRKEKGRRKAAVMAAFYVLFSIFAPREARAMKTKLIIFDFDGTLGDTRRTIVTTMQMTIAAHGLQKRSEEEYAATIGLPLEGCFKTLFPELSTENTLRCAETYRSIFSDNVKNIKPQAFPKVVETLAALRKQGITLAIASSRSHKSLEELTHDLRIADNISCLVGADDVENAKPNPEPVLRILRATGHAASQTIVVGDMNVDILMGARAGTWTCGVTYGNGTRKELEIAGADFIVDGIEEIISVSSAIYC